MDGVFVSVIYSTAVTGLERDDISSDFDWMGTIHHSHHVIDNGVICPYIKCIQKCPSETEQAGL